MREQLFLVLALSLLFAAFAPAQDAAQQAAQAAQQAARQAQQNAINSTNTVYVPFTALKPSISLKSGNYSSPVTVRLKALT